MRVWESGSKVGVPFPDPHKHPCRHMCRWLHRHTHTRAHVLLPLSSFQSLAWLQNIVTSSSPSQTFSSSEVGEGDSGTAEGEGPVRASANCTPCCSA